jgi:hypothetical protein
MADLLTRHLAVSLLPLCTCWCVWLLLSPLFRLTGHPMGVVRSRSENGQPNSQPAESFRPLSSRPMRVRDGWPNRRGGQGGGGGRRATRHSSVNDNHPATAPRSASQPLRVRCVAAAAAFSVSCCDSIGSALLRHLRANKGEGDEDMGEKRCWQQPSTLTAAAARLVRWADGVTRVRACGFARLLCHCPQPPFPLPPCSRSSKQW